MIIFVRVPLATFCHKPNRGIWRDQKTTITLMTNTSWTLPRRKWPRVCAAIKLLGRSRLLLLAPLSNPGIKSRIRQKIPGGWRTTFHDNHSVRLKLNWISNLHGTKSKQRMCGVASVSTVCVSSTCIATSQHPYKPEESQPDNFLGTKLQSSHQNMIHHLRHNDKSLFTEKLVQGDPWTSALPEEEMNGEEVWQMHRLKHMLIHTAKEQISEDVVGIVVFASVSSRSMDRDPSWTPCGRSCYGTCQIKPTHLAKLHAPRKTWTTVTTPYRNYTRNLGTQNC